MMESFFESVSIWLEPLFLIYFGSINVLYVTLLLLGVTKIYRREKELKAQDFLHDIQSNSLPGITFLMPAYNEAKDIREAIDNLISLTYPAKEIIVINDGSTDETLDIIKKRLNLVKIPEYYEKTLISKPVRGFYRSLSHHEVWVIDKENGTKHDALNAGLNAVKTPYFVTFDADSRIDNKGFEALIRPIFTSPQTIAMGASVRILNGCEVGYRAINSEDFPKSYIAAMQSLEYLRAFLMRQGWDYIGGNHILSGAFTVFDHAAVVKSGGFQETVADDLEAILRLNRIMLKTKTPYDIVYLPDPVAWTEGPTTFKELGRQRQNWQRGLWESLWFHKVMIFNPVYKVYGLFVMPFVVLSEAIEPIMELIGITYVIIGLYLGLVNIAFVWVLVFIMWGYTFVYSVFCLFIEDQSFRRYSSPRALLLLLWYSLIENFGYRQLTLIWRIRGIISFFARFPLIQKVSRRINKMVKAIEAKGPMKWKRY
ncbi:MAG: glycosyltransferase family 2 protein [Chlamydiia bacterium]|nr:glycosyltransferase family 2 protein [Chlamydiia bacterium]